MLRVSVLSLLCGLAACSPERFGKSAASFSDSVAEVSKALDGSLDGLAADERGLRDDRLTAAGVRPAMSVVCVRHDVSGRGGSREPGCGLVATRTSVPEISPAWRQAPAAADVLRALADYAKGLEELTSAEDRKAVDDAVDKVAAALGAVVALAGQPQFGVPAIAAVKVGGFVYAEAWDARRYRNLRNAVAIGQRALVILEPVLATAFEGVNGARIDIGEQTGLLLVGEVRPGGYDYPATFARASDQMAKIEALQRANPGGALSAMLQAHEKLADAVDRNDGTVVAVVQAMGEFATRAGNLRSAVETARKGG